MSGRISFQGPETAAVGSEHLIAEHDYAVLIQTELEFRIRDDDPSGQRIISAFFVQRDRAVADGLGVFSAAAGELLLQHFHALLEADVLVVVADLCLGAGCVDGLGKLGALLKSLRKLNAAHCAVLLVACPAAARDIAADDALDGEHRELLAHHAVAVKALLTEKLGHVIDIDADHVVRDDIFGIIKPETGHLRQNGPLLHDLVLQDHIKCRDPVRRHHNELITDVIDLTYFAFLNGCIFLHACLLLILIMRMQNTDDS